MGRTLPSFTQLILGEQGALAKFRRALRREDQRALDDLFRAARYHVAAAAYASHLLPFETMLLAMLIEEHKRVERLTVLLEGVLEKLRDSKGTPAEFSILDFGTQRVPRISDCESPDPTGPQVQPAVGILAEHPAAQPCTEQSERMPDEQRISNFGF